MIFPTAILALGLAAAANAVPLEERATMCVSGLYIIAVRGTGESPGAGKVGQVGNMTVDRVPGSTVVPVTYDASFYPYDASVQDGVNNTIAAIQNYVDACGKKSKVALIGFSQGGQVITDVLAGGTNNAVPLAKKYANYVRSVAVFGDPSFRTGQSFDRGTATNDGRFARNNATLAKLNSYSAKLRSYCDDQDYWCASGSNAFNSVHDNEVPNHASEATDFIVSLA